MSVRVEAQHGKKAQRVEQEYLTEPPREDVKLRAVSM